MLDKTKLSDEIWEELSRAAWKVRDNAYLIGNTKVGAALLSKGNNIYVGCNVEHRYRCHDVHAEVNAISNMISGGESELLAILIAAERDRFTPCGGCMDWIMQHCNEDCFVAYQSSKSGPIKVHKASELMPFYPE